MRGCEALRFEIGDGEEKREDEDRWVSRICHKRRKELISKRLRFQAFALASCVHLILSRNWRV
jgi:hypothetical protein